LIRPTVMKIAWGNHFSLLKFSCIRLSLNRNFEAYFLLNHWTCWNWEFNYWQILIRPTVMKIAWGNHFSLLKFSCIRISLDRNF
jgi:hypothetical protein